MILKRGFMISEIKDSEVKESAIKVFEIPLDEIFSDEEFNCRGKIVPIDVLDLARSIDMHGLQQVIVVQPFHSETDTKIRYRIVSGHRRYTAFIVLGKKTIPATIKSDLSELDAMKLNFEENLKRKNLNILQEAKTLKRLKEKGLGQEDAAKELGMSRGWIQVRYMILDLPEEIQQEVGAGFINQEQIREIYRMPKDEQYEMVRKIKVARMSGESIQRFKIKKKPPKAYEKRERDANEMFELQGIIREVIGNGFPTRILAWCSAEISDYEIHRDLREAAAAIGKRYDIPREMVESMNMVGTK